MTPAALLNGSASAGAIPPEVVDSLKDQGFTVLASGHDWNAKLVFNHTQEPFANTKFRQAIAYAIDREKLVQIAQRGHALAGSPGLLPADNPWYTAEINNYDYNPEKSLELFKELGYHLQDGLLQKNGQPLTLELLFTSTFSRDAELIKLDLEKVGIQVTVQSLEAKTVDAKIKDWDFQMAISGHGGLGGDPEIFNRVVLGDGFNSARYHANESLTEMILTQMTLMDKEERRQMVAAIQKLYAQELPTLTLYYPDNYWAHNGEVDLYYTPQGIGSGVPLPLNKLSFVK
jgi:peptide/nickel transport system substrate-binding protein